MADVTRDLESFTHVLSRTYDYLATWSSARKTDLERLNCCPLREAVLRLKAPPNPGEVNGYSHILMRTDANQRSLQPPYEGPYKVLEHGELAFSLNVGGKLKAVFLDRLTSFFQ